ncbi:MAG: NADH:flavin oxidoreductase [Deltaproteobacteria bacterium]|jgi:2,4-dienoyl-CoA reductase-like NADH-dependent reductase (Old Yellow Enzyme family)|nr:NADH:flavin oxidoreductase [Deltaproteobacteria bacterium]
MTQDKISMFDSFKIGRLTVKNRLVRSATFEFGADDGLITPRLLELYRDLAAGGSGLIITGHEGITASGRTGPSMVDTTHPQYVEKLSQIARAVHDEGSLIFVQINHGGYKTAKLDGYDRFGVSAAEVDGQPYREMTPEDIQKVTFDFAAAAKKVKEAGCDGVQIHASHGYLLCTFLSPYFNSRKDSYGGPIENRARILFDAYEAVRAAVGPDFPVGLKIHFSDRVDPTITPQDCVYAAEELTKRGLDMIEISSGITPDGGSSSFSPFVKDESKEAIFLPGAARIAQTVTQIPVISVGAYRTPSVIERSLFYAGISAVSLCRPLICEPNLPNRWRNDPAKAKCVSCNKCFTSKEIISCMVNK